MHSHEIISSITDAMSVRVAKEEAWDRVEALQLDSEQFKRSFL